MFAPSGAFKTSSSEYPILRDISNEDFFRLIESPQQLPWLEFPMAIFL